MPKFETKTKSEPIKCNWCNREKPVNEYNYCEKCDKLKFTYLVFREGKVLETDYYYGNHARKPIYATKDQIIDFLTEELDCKIKCLNKAKEAARSFTESVRELADIWR